MLYNYHTHTAFCDGKNNAEEMVRKEGPVWLMNHCKAHFRTTDKVLAACGKSRADLPPEGQVVSSAMRTPKAENMV